MGIISSFSSLQALEGWPLLELPCNVRSDGLTIDQRLRQGIAPGKLVIPHELRAKLEGWPRLEQQGGGEEGGHSEELDSTSAVSNRPDWFTGLRQSCSAVADSFTLLTLVLTLVFWLLLMLLPEFVTL